MAVHALLRLNFDALGCCLRGTVLKGGEHSWECNTYVELCGGRGSRLRNVALAGGLGAWLPSGLAGPRLVRHFGWIEGGKDEIEGVRSVIDGMDVPAWRG